MEVSQGVREEMKKIAKRFPAGLEYDFAFDTTASVKESIKEVLYTLSQAILLVIIVIFVFLQNPRSTIIPAITIPVSLIGTFLFMKAFGFSINTLTLFGITLATGLVVDDAIVVIENINRYIEEKNMKPMEAASVAMAEVTGPVIAISLVLSAVFIPVAFFPGTVGQLYKQFALTIAFSVLISTINALTLTPALSGQWLKHEDEEKKNYFFRQFDKFMTWLRNSYGQSLKTVLRFKELTMIFFVASLFATYWLFKTIPTAFVPNEDQGYFITLVQCPEGSSLEYTKKVVQEVEKEMDKIPEILSVFGIAGFSFSGNGSNNGILFANLKDWRYRRSHESSLNGVINKLRAPLGLITGGTVIPFNPPPIEGLGSYGGFVFKVLDLYGSDINMLAKSTTDLCRVANQQKDLRGVFSSFNANSPQLIVDVNRDLAESLHIPVNEIFNTLEIFLGSWYVNDFDFLNRIYRVYVQADKNFRSNPNNIDQFYVRSLDGKMVPISNLITTQKTTSPQTIMHYNLFRSTEINGSPAPGYSSGQAMQIMADLADKNLPKGLSYAWSGISLEEEESGTKALVIFVLGLVFVFLVLAAQYESLFDPLIIILSVPLAMLGALLAQWLRGLENDIFCQIGLVMLIGLASKNAILIVEFANKLHEKGKPLEEAVVEASTIRLRPILMTSLAFIMGIIPLVFAHGAGAGARNSLGTAVFGGMIVSSILSLYIVPVIYLYISRIREYFRLKRRN
jgi:HAE1 family hydrophobic/amphiphilic exporter-1